MAKPVTRSFWPRRWLRAFAGGFLLSGISVGAIWASEPQIPHLPAPPIENTQTPLLLPTGQVNSFVDDQKIPSKGAKDDIFLPKVAEDPKTKTNSTEVPKVKADPKETVEVKPAAKRISFNMEGQPWDRILTWLADETGKPFISKDKPTGSFTGKVPKKNGKAQEYTIAEIMDIINEQLISEGYLLVRREASFTLVPLDDKLNPGDFRLVNESELDEQGGLEIVRAVIQLKAIEAEELAPELKSMVGKFGVINVISRANQLVIFDQVRNIRRILNDIRAAEKELSESETYTRVLKYCKARAAEETLIKVIGDPREAMRAAFGNPGRDGGMRDMRDFRDPRMLQQPQQSTMPRNRVFSFAADERLNAVLVTGPADVISKAKKVLDELDKPQQGQTPVALGEPLMKTYSVQPGTADAISRMLSDIFKPGPNLKITPIGQNQIMVWAGPQDQMDIARIIADGTSNKAAITKIIPVATLDAARVVTQFKEIFGDATKGGPSIVANDRNELLVRGTSDQIAEIEMALKAMEPGGLTGVGARRIALPIKDGSARNLADAISEMLREMGYSPRVISPGLGKEQPEMPLPKIKQQPPIKQPPQTRGHGPDLDDQQVAMQNPFFDPRDAKNDAPQPKKGSVTLMAVGNRLFVESDDPELLATVAELSRLLTQAPGEGDFTVLRLKNANVVDVARVIDQWFNGTPQQNSQQRGPSGFPFPGAGGIFGGRGGGGLFGGGGPQPPATSGNTANNASGAGGRVRVVAHADSNSLLVRASFVDLMTIKTMLKDVLDRQDNDSDALMRPYMIKLQYATATEVAQVVRDVFREKTNQASTGGAGAAGITPFGLFGGGTRNQTDATGRARQVTLSIGVDDRTNSLIVNCPKAVYDEVSALCKELDEAAKDSSRTVKVISIRGIDPSLVQQAVDAIQGRTISRQQNPFGFGSGFGGGFGNRLGGGGSPFGGGGGSPFGGFGGRGGMFQGGGSPFGGGGGGGGRQRPIPGPNDDARGPDFFEQRDMDVPSRSAFFDPQQARLQQVQHTEPVCGVPGSELVSFQNDPKPKDPKDSNVEPKKEDDIRGPRASVTAQALPELGVIVISANNQTDLEEILKIIEFIEKLGSNSEPELRIVPLDYGDAANIVSILNQAFSRINVTTGGNVAISGNQRVGTPFPFGQQGLTGGTQSSGSVLMIPLPRFNSILVGAAKARLEYVEKEIKKLDRPTTQQGQATAIPLKKASAQIVANQIQQFYNQRYSAAGETSQQNSVRVTFDVSTNTVFVQAGPADLEEIRGLINRIENTVSNAVNEVRVIRLRNALADELSLTLQDVLLQGIVPQSIGTTSGLGTGIIGGQATGTNIGGGLGGQLGGGLGGQLGAGLAGRQGLGGGIGGQFTNATKTVSLRLVSGNGKGPALESGMIEDVHITADVRTNSLIISAPANSKTMDLLQALIRELDVASPAQSSVNIFTLKKADAVLTANLLQNLFLGGGTTATTGRQQAGGIGGGLNQTGGTAAATRPLLSLTGSPSDGAILIDLRISVDERTNSIIVAGSPNDLETIGAVISRLEDSDVQQRINETYKLRNAAAADVVNSLQGFLNNTLTVISNGNQLSGFQEIQRTVVLAAEPVTNTILISATPQYYAQVVKLIEQLDCQPAQLAIECLIAEVILDNSEEFGVEIGLQTPVLFQRSVIPASSISLSNATGGFVPPGVSVTSTATQYAIPGFGFNTTQDLPSGNVVRPHVVGYQGLGNLGVGRANANGIGGFVFSAASDTVSVLVRALKTQGRIDILNNPVLQTLDNQTGYVQVGQSFPYVTGGQFTALGTFQPQIDYRDIGVTLRVTPRISPDGRVLMRVEPSISAAEPSQIDLGNGLLATAFNVQQVQTTVQIADGETVVIGGLINKVSQKNENKIPFLGDIPYFGALFRYRTQTQRKRELVVILTPHIIRNDDDANKFSVERVKKMHWNLPDVEKIYGPKELFRNPTAEEGCDGPDGVKPGASNGSVVPLPGSTVPQPGVAPLPSPTPVPGAISPATPGTQTPATGTTTQATPATGTTPQPAAVVQASAKQSTTVPASSKDAQKKESRGWNLFRRD